jgi:hypothetical protein
MNYQKFLKIQIVKNNKQNKNQERTSGLPTYKDDDKDSANVVDRDTAAIILSVVAVLHKAEGKKLLKV